MPDPVAATKVKPEVKAKIEWLAFRLNRSQSWVNERVSTAAAVDFADALSELDEVAA